MYDCVLFACFCQIAMLTKSVLLTVALSFVIYSLVNYTTSEQGYMQWTSFYKKTIPKYLGKVIELMNVGEEVAFIRKYRKLFGRKVENSSEIVINEKYFDGVRCLVFTPTKLIDRKANSALIFFHGGGWVYQSPDVPMFAHMASYWAKEASTIVFSVDYRLAPENPFPAAIEDSKAVLLYILKHAAFLNVDEKKVGLIGDSAGGNIVVVLGVYLAHVRRKENLPQPKLIMSLYPVLQCTHFDLASYAQNELDSILTREDMIYYCLRYLHGKIGAKYYSKVVQNAYQIDEKLTNTILRESGRESVMKFGEDPNMFSPLYTRDVSLFHEMPYLYLLSMDNDVLRDEAFEFKKVLENNKVKFTHLHYSGPHGAPFLYQQNSNYLQGKTIFDDIIMTLKSALN